MENEGGDVAWGVATFQRLLAWQHCHRLTLLTYRFTSQFPKTDVYGITSQMRRAAASAAATIAEGSAKRGSPELRRFLDMALGSLSELAYFGLLARDLGLLPEAEWNEFEQLSEEAGKTTIWACTRRSPAGVDPGGDTTGRR